MLTGVSRLFGGWHVGKVDPLDDHIRLGTDYMINRMATNRVITIAIITVLVILIVAVIFSKFR